MGKLEFVEDYQLCSHTIKNINLLPSMLKQLIVDVGEKRCFRINNFIFYEFNRKRNFVKICEQNFPWLDLTIWWVYNIKEDNYELKILEFSNPIVSKGISITIIRDFDVFMRTLERLSIDKLLEMLQQEDI